MVVARVVFALHLTLVTPAFAAEEEKAISPPAYLDDRSDPQSLVRSLYNAVNRREYARAWSYFSTAPAKTFAKFTEGYAGTQFVDIVVGKPVADGAAGSTFYLLPVAIRATSFDGVESAFAGCYTLRQVNPQAQEPPYRPLGIEKGGLKPMGAPGRLAGLLPESCEGRAAEPPTVAELAERAAVLFRAGRREVCGQADELKPFTTGGEPEIHELKFKYAHEGPEDPERKAVLFRFSCGLYAYNVSEVYYLANQYGEIQEVAFSEPELDIEYVDDTNSTVKSMKVIGYSATPVLVNSVFDPKSGTISSFSKWRGIADAFSAGAWAFRDGRFVLISYVVDAAYDEREEPVDVLNLETTP